MHKTCENIITEHRHIAHARTANPKIQQVSPTYPACFATSCFTPHHLSSLFLFFSCYFSIAFTPPIDLSPFSNSSGGSSASVAVLRLVFTGFSQLCWNI